MSRANEPAFPKLASIELDGDRHSQKGQAFYHGTGLTKREYFAAMAMQGFINDGCFRVIRGDEGPSEGDLASQQRAFDLGAFAVAHLAVAQADALLAELSKESAK